jgi:hypothetical protein
MNKRTMAFLAVAATLGAGGLGLAACSSDSGGGGLPTVGDSSTQDQTTGGDSGGGTDTGGGNDTGGGGDTGGGDGGLNDCGASPTLHPADGGQGPFCQFHDGGAPDASLNCASGEVCCHPDNTGPEICAQNANTCPPIPDGGEIYECDTPLMCANGNDVCCFQGEVKSVPGCPADFLVYSKQTGGTKCEKTACAAGELEVCAQQSDCKTGTCTPFKARGGKQYGYCKP